MLTKITAIPHHIDGNALVSVLNIVRKNDYIKLCLTPECVETLVIVRGGRTMQSSRLEELLAWFESAREALEFLSACGCATSPLVSVEWI